MDNLITEALENVEEDRRALKVKILEELIKTGDRLSEQMLKLTDDLYQIHEDMELVADSDFIPTRSNINELKSSGMAGDMQRGLSLASKVLGDR